MARQINTTCNLIMGYIKCELPEDTVDVMVKVRTVGALTPYKKTGRTTH